MSDQMMKLTAVHGSRDWDSKFGPMSTYTVEVEGLVGRHELNQKRETSAPKIGDELLGHVEDGGSWPDGKPKPPKIKKAQQGGFGGAGSGPRPEDPQRAKRILRQHSQDMALRYATIRQAQGKLPDSFSFEDIQKLADRFDADAEAAAA